METLMNDLLTFREAGKKLGVDRSLLKQLLRDGDLPEAEKIRRSEGWVWVIPQTAMQRLAKHPKLIIDVRNEETITLVSEEASSEEINQIVESLQEEPIRHLSLAAQQKASEIKSPGEIIDMALLDRLLAIQEAKTESSCRAEQAEYALEAAKTHYSSLEEELTVEKKERSTAAERLREERLARKIADVKIAELNEQLIRETTIAESERKERIAASDRTMNAEQKTSYAVASMSWLARRRYLKAMKRDQH